MKIENPRTVRTVMTPEAWAALSYVEQKSRWSSLSPEEQQTIRAAESAPNLQPPVADKPDSAQVPGSALCCYIFAVISILGAAVTVVGVAFADVPEAGIIIASCIASSVLWWVLADIVSHLAKLSARR